ncbi:unnamed protein product [Leptosia nina]|uniref:Uncharacterized protein n=1 Tax=Leptosia nina TaxID=320188 RepID=A0AAV1IRW8_9NEOP
MSTSTRVPRRNMFPPSVTLSSDICRFQCGRQWRSPSCEASARPRPLCVINRVARVHEALMATLMRQQCEAVLVRSELRAAGARWMRSQKAWEAYGHSATILVPPYR